MLYYFLINFYRKIFSNCNGIVDLCVRDWGGNPFCFAIAGKKIAVKSPVPSGATAQVGDMPRLVVKRLIG
jgi:hypothetical protein